MSTDTYAYPFDPTGTAVSNKITSERQILSAPQHSRFFVIIPLAGPFFRTGLKLIHHPSGRVLVEGVDYAATHRFHDASLACGKPVFGSITFFDHNLVGLVELEYQSIGGPWTLPLAEITEILQNSLTNPRITTWEMIVELPHEFPVVDHPWELTDLVGMSQVVEKLAEIEDAIRDAANGTDDTHINDLDNPHQVTKAQIGLSNVFNFAVASSVEATGGTQNDKYMTPLRTREAIMSTVATAYNAHAANMANPHGTTKSQIGLSNVLNYGTATPAQAVEGVATDLYMTPVATAAALASLTDGVITPHINSQNNPHQTTKAQIGLGSVENLALADQSTAVAGASNGFYMTPLRTRELVDALLGETVINHINDRSNPHGVTKSHIGLSNVPNLPLATALAAQTGSDDSGFMTPRLTHEAIIAFGGTGGSGSGIDSVHRSNLSNPHETTAAQVGAYSTSQVDASMAQKLDVLGTAANSNRLGGRDTNELLRLARARFDWPAVVAQEVDDGAGGTITINDGITWTALGSFVPPGVIDEDHPVADMVFYFTGGDKRQATEIPIYLVKLNIYPTPKLDVQQLAGVVSATQFGYVRDNTTQAITVFVKSAAERNSASVLVMSDPTNGLGMTSPPLENEPFNIVYADSFMYLGGSPNTDAFAGDMLFGKNPHHEQLPDFSTGLEFVNFAFGDEEILKARQTFSRIADDFHDFIPASAWGDKPRHAVKADMLGWMWKQSLSSLVQVPASSSLSMLLAQNSYTSYAFEVELSSVSASDMAIGVCAAFTRKNGKDYGIYVMLSPNGLLTASVGGNLPGGDIYKRCTIAYNALQDDAIDLASTNTGFAGATDWPLAGPCRVRITRNGGVIYVQVSPFGSVNVADGQTVTIGLDDIPELAVFKGPTQWGLVNYGQANSAYKIISRPDSNPPYVAYSVDADGNDTSTFYRFNGAVWLAQPMTLENSFIKPQRLYYSELNHRLYWARRDGTLRQLGIEAYTDTPVTVLIE